MGTLQDVSVLVRTILDEWVGVGEKSTVNPFLSPLSTRLLLSPTVHRSVFPSRPTTTGDIDGNNSSEGCWNYKKSALLFASKGRCSDLPDDGRRRER